MEVKLFKSLLGAFSAEECFDKKVDLLLSYDLKKLTNPQIQKILDTLDEAETKKLISAISKKVGE